MIIFRYNQDVDLKFITKENLHHANLIVSDEEILDKVHIKHCPESDVLLPTAYLAKKFVETADGEIEIGKKEGVEVEWVEDPAAAARLVLLPSPTRILLMTPKGISVVWEA